MDLHRENSKKIKKKLVIMVHVDVQLNAKTNIRPFFFFLDKTSLPTETNLEKLFKSTLRCCKFSVVFRTHTHLFNFYRFKDLLPKELMLINKSVVAATPLI